MHCLRFFKILSIFVLIITNSQMSFAAGLNSTGDTTVTSKRYVDNGLDKKQDTLIPGNNISIGNDGKTISANIDANVVTADNGTGGYVVNSVTVDTDDPSQVNVARSYIKVPISTGIPSMTPPTSFAEIWLE